MSIGYACLTVGVPDTGFKTCRKANATEEKLKELIYFNLESLEKSLSTILKIISNYSVLVQILFHLDQVRSIH